VAIGSAFVGASGAVIGVKTATGRQTPITAYNGNGDGYKPSNP
jgi:hypothetical protein